LLLSSPLRAFISPDPEGHVASMDLYSYCDGDPVNQYDADGRDHIDLFDTTTLGGIGHTASLWPTGNGQWVYTSKDGRRFFVFGETLDTQHYYSSLAEFYASSDAKRYNNSVLVSSTPAQDAAGLAAVSSKVSMPYYLIKNDCLTTTETGDNASGINTPSRLSVMTPSGYSNQMLKVGIGNDVSSATGNLITIGNNSVINILPQDQALTQYYGGTKNNFNNIISSFGVNANQQNSVPINNVAAPSGDPLSAKITTWK